MLSENGRALARSVHVEHKVEHKNSTKIKNSQIPLPFRNHLRYVVLVGLLINIERQAPYLLNIKMR